MTQTTYSELNGRMAMPQRGVWPERLTTMVHRTVARWRQWQESQRTRRMLRTLPDHLLWDIGLTRAEIEQDATRPFWSLLDTTWLDQRRQSNSRRLRYRRR
jgi:uncharacterized protein YjiS (DUF1127 family)